MKINDIFLEIEEFLMRIWDNVSCLNQSMGKELYSL